MHLLRGRQEVWRRTATVLGFVLILVFALAAHERGAKRAVDRFLSWLKPIGGGLPGYIDRMTGEAKFLPVDTPYFDIVASGLYRSLATRVGLFEEAIEADALLLMTQSDDGGWYWARAIADLSVVDGRKATLTGLWAVADLTP